MAIAAGEGNYLIDHAGRRYFDGVSSLWCNVHGHRHPLLDRALRDQLERIAHTTFLGSPTSRRYASGRPRCLALTSRDRPSTEHRCAIRVDGTIWL
jgi:4-aminobutyrate aminotransferase-like enzyme